MWRRIVYVSVLTLLDIISRSLRTLGKHEDLLYQAKLMPLVASVTREGLAVSLLKGKYWCHWSLSWWETDPFCTLNYFTCIRLHISYADVSVSDPGGTPLLHSSNCPKLVMHLYCLLLGYWGVSSSGLLWVLAGAPSSVVSGFGDRAGPLPYGSHLLDSLRALLALIFLGTLACPSPHAAHSGDRLSSLFTSYLFLLGSNQCSQCGRFSNFIGSRRQCVSFCF